MTRRANLLILRWKLRFVDVACMSSMKDGMGKGEQLRHKKLLGSAVCRISVGQYHLPETGLVSIHVMSSAN